MYSDDSTISCTVQSENTEEGDGPRSTRSCANCLLSCKALYDYLTFHQFQEICQLICLWQDKKVIKFVVLFLLTVLYYSIVFIIFWNIVKHLNVTFSSTALPGFKSGRQNIDVWDILMPKLSDLWKQT